MLSGRKSLDGESQWTRIEYRIKAWVYNMMHELVQAQVISSLVYKLLLIVETLQLLWYPIHPHFDFLWSVKVVDWYREFLKYLQFDGFLTDSNYSKNIFIGILYVVFAVQIIMTIIIICHMKFSSSKKLPSTMMAYSTKTLSGYMLLLNTILALPFYNVFLAAFICTQGDPIHGDMECYKTTYFVHFVAALLGMIMLIPTTLLSAVLCIDLNPWSRTPFAAPKSRLSLLKLLIKVFVPLYFIIDYTGSAGKEFTIVYSVIWLFMLVLRYRQTPYYSKSVFNLTLSLEMLLFWTSLVSLFHAFIDNKPIDNIGFLFLWVGAPFIVFTFAVVVNKRRKTYRNVLMKNLKKDTEVEMYIANIISLIEERNNMRKRMTLEGILKFHMKTCPNKELGCVCHSLHTEYLKDQDAPEKMWYLWVKAIILDGISRFPKSSRLRILYAYIQREKLQNKFKALFEIMYAHNNKPTIEEEFSIHRYKNLIEEDMIESDMKIAENKGVNVNVIVDFENRFVDFQGVIGAAVDLHLDFWRELQETNPEIQKLQGLGSLITKSVEEVNRHYHNLTQINPNHVKMLKVYGNFLHDIVNDEAEGQKIIEKAEYNNRSAMVNRQFLDNERIKYGDNANTCIITISGESSNMGVVTNVNNDITRILGFNKSELINQNIVAIMPKFLTEIHDGFMQNYFDSSDAKVIAIERIVFPINKDGYVLPCTLMAKVLPNLDDGLKLVGFLKEIDENLALNKEDGEPGEEEEAHYIMYDSNTGIIHGITYGCKKEFGIPSSLVQNADVAMDEFTIDQIFPELPQVNLDDLRSSGTIITTLDTTTLGQDFIIEKDENSYAEGDDKEKKFRKAKVKMSLFQDDQYGDISLKVLKFVEILEEGEMTPAKHSANQRDIAEQGKYAGMVKVRPGEQNDDFEGSRLGDQNASEMESNANDINEEMRDLKEFKALISEKTVPKSIRILRNALILIHVFLLTLTCLGLAFYSNLVDEFDGATTTISSSYRRHDIMGEINYRLRKLQLLASDLITSDPAVKNATAAVLKAQETVLIDSLRAVTLQIGDQQDDLKNLGFTTVETDNVWVESLVQTGAKGEDRFFSDAMSQYTSHSTSASSASLDAFVSPLVTDSTKASFFYVRRNGLGPLRIKSESNAQVITDFYIDRTGSFDTRFKIIMIALIVLMALSELIVIPIIFSVHKTATKVLSLFGYIPLTEISALANKCERYVQLYLENHRIQKDFLDGEGEEDNSDRPSKTSRMGDHTYVEVNQNQDNNMQGSMRGVDQTEINASYLVEMSLEDSARKIHGLRVPETAAMKQVNSPGDIGGIGYDGKRITSMENSNKPLKEDYNASLNNHLMLSGSPDAKRQGKEDEKKAYVQDNEEDADLANDRPQKLLNSKDNTKSKVIIQIGVYGALIVAYGIMNYLIEKTSLDNTKTALRHLQLVSQRMPNARFLNDFTLEVIAQTNYTDVYTYPKQPFIDYRTDYQTRTRTNNQQLKDSSQSGFPNEFDSYLTTFNAYENGDLCAGYYSYNATLQTNCSNVAGGLLKNGLTLSLTRIVQISDDLIKMFNATARDAAGQKQVLTDPQFQQTESLIDMIAPVVNAIRDKFLASFSDYLSYSWTIARVRFAVFVSLACLTMIFFWVPYLNSLRDKVFRTKGMLNMIPMELITKNAALRSLFVNSGDILQAVK